MATAGDLLAIQLRRVVLDTAAKIAAAPTDKPMLCFACPDGELRDMACVALVGLIAPHRTDPTTGGGYAICSACAASDTDARVLAALRRQLWRGVSGGENPRIDGVEPFRTGIWLRGRRGLRR